MLLAACSLDRRQMAPLVEKQNHKKQTLGHTLRTSTHTKSSVIFFGGGELPPEKSPHEKGRRLAHQSRGHVPGARGGRVDALHA